MIRPDLSAIAIRRLTAEDRTDWERLFRAYMAFYARDCAEAVYTRAWAGFLADTRIHALGAFVGGRLVGITHFLAHANTSAADVCYLQDLYTDADSRGHGVGRALIAAVVAWAGKQGCARVYWMTQQDNATARRLYDAVAENRGFIRYQIELA